MRIRCHPRGQPHSLANIPIRPPRWLVVMVRAPLCGQVKTRLGRGIGSVAATWFYRHATAALLKRIDEPRCWTTLLAITPDHHIATRAYPSHLARVRQGDGDLGQRLQRLVDGLPPGPVIIIGSDAPGITQRDLAAAFRRLDGADAVIGPSSDGGYWLIGLRRRPHVPQPFARVRWSSPCALTDTYRGLASYRVCETIPRDDIDTADDLMRVGRAAGRVVPPR